MTDELDMSGRIVLVTGGARGIGRGISERFLAAGAGVVICGRSEPAVLPTAAGRTAVFVAADVRDPDAVAALVATTVEAHGRLDVLVNNAGGSPSVDSATVSPKFSRSIIELNLLAPLVCAREANAVMQIQPDGGSIVNIASVSGLRPSPGTAAYGAAKAGLLNLTQTLAVDYAPKVRVNAVERGPDPHRAVAPPLRRRGGHRRGRRDRPARAHGNARGHRERLPLPRLPPRRVRLRREPPGARRWRAPRVPRRGHDLSRPDGSVRFDIARTPREHAAMTHPLDMLTGEEISLASRIVRADGRFTDCSTFVHVVLHEPTKDALAAAGDGPLPREVEVQLVTGPEIQVVEVLASLTQQKVLRWDVVDGMRPTLLFGEAAHAIFRTKEHPDYVAALARRGITDVDNVQIDPWPAGAFGYEAEEGRRIARCISFLRTDPQDNGYARPIEGLIVHFDLGRKEVIEVIDHGVTTLPTQHARYFAPDNEPLRTDLKPLEITQPDGPSFTVDGNLVEWQKWSLRLTFDPYEGVVLHQVTYDDDGRVRPILHRASITEMVVPYGDPTEVQGFKNAFDVGEWGLGRMTQSLTLGCDCLGVIHYFDATLAKEDGEPYVIENAICMHEEDYGILWKHVDLFGGTSEVRRSRRLVVSFISTVGNYEYGFFWYFYQDGNIQLEVKLTGIVSPMAVEPGTEPEYAGIVAPGVAAPNHQHMFSARLDFDVDGTRNEVYEVEAERVPTGAENPWGNAFRARKTRLDSELAATT